MILLKNRHHPVLATVLSSPLEEEEQSTYPDPMPARVRLGHVTLINDNEAFLQAFDCSIEMYYEDEQAYVQRIRTAQDLCKELLDILTDSDPEMELSWRLGCVAGRIAGLLNPDLAETNPRMSCLEALSRKCEVLYPGPEQWSIYSRAIHKAACIDNVPIEGLPVRGQVTSPSCQQEERPIASSAVNGASLPSLPSLAALLARPDFQQGLVDAQEQFLGDYEPAPLTTEEMIDEAEMNVSRRATKRDKKRCRATGEEWDGSIYFYNLGFVVGTINEGLTYA